MPRKGSPTNRLSDSALPRAALVQLAAGAIAAAAWLALSLSPASACLFQGALAASIALAQRQAGWWIAIHAGFLPLLYSASLLALPPAVPLTAFVLLLVVFGSITHTRVPLFLSSHECGDVLAQTLAGLSAPRATDLGCGMGGVLCRLAALRPDARLTGFELAPASWLLARWRARSRPAMKVRRADFMQQPWVDYDLIYAFLSPVAMDAVGRKARAEMAPGALLVSNSFPIDGFEPIAILELPDRRRTHLYVYRPGGHGDSQAHDKWPIPRAFRATGDAPAAG